MFKAKLTKKLVERIPFHVLQDQHPRWNVLMPITAVTSDGTHYSTGKTFFDHFNDMIVCDWAATPDSDKFWEKTFSREHGEGTEVNCQWDLYHNTGNYSVRWTREEQFLMEKTRFQIVQVWGGRVRYCLPCTTTSRMVPNRNSGSFQDANFVVLSDGL